MSADLASGGSYQCRAKTELDEVSLEHRLAVLARTHFRLSPQHTTIIQVISTSHFKPHTSHMLYVTTGGLGEPLL